MFFIELEKHRMNEIDFVSTALHIRNDDSNRLGFYWVNIDRNSMNNNTNKEEEEAEETEE